MVIPVVRLGTWNQPHTKPGKAPTIKKPDIRSTHDFFRDKGCKPGVESGHGITHLLQEAH